MLSECPDNGGHGVNLLRFGRTLSPASAIVHGHGQWHGQWLLLASRPLMMVRGCLALPPGPFSSPLLASTSSSMASSSPSSDSNSSSPDSAFIHCVCLESSANCALWTCFYTCGHSISNKCLQFWVVVCNEWRQVCSLCSNIADCGKHFASHELSFENMSRVILQLVF